MKMDEELMEELYSSMVLEHSKNPRNFKTLQCGCHAKGKNPSCGDELTLFIQFQDDIIEDIGFMGQGCALSMASASLMTQAVKGKSISQTIKTHDDFIDFIVNDSQLSEDYEPLHIFTGVKNFPLRIKCVLLAWRTLQSLTKNMNEQRNAS